MLDVLLSERNKEVGVIVMMKSLLIFHFLTHIACGSNVCLLHSDIHVVSFDCLEHRVGLIPGVGLELHIRVFLLESGCLTARCSSSRAHGSFEDAIIVLVLHDNAFISMTHLALLCQDCRY